MNLESKRDERFGGTQGDRGAEDALEAVRLELVVVDATRRVIDEAIALETRHDEDRLPAVDL